jgi:hypothetical protein
MATDNFCFYLQNRLIQTSQTGGQWYSDTSPLVFPAYMVDEVSSPQVDGQLAVGGSLLINPEGHDHLQLLPLVDGRKLFFTSSVSFRKISWIVCT